MSEQEFNILQTNIRDVEWLVELRSKAKMEQLAMIILKCPCCVARIARTFWMYSDDELAARLVGYKIKLLDQINIQDAYEK